jgi:hypothetical protein
MHRPCSLDELRSFQTAVAAIGRIGREIELRAVWVRVGRDLLAAGTCAAAIIAGLVGISEPAAGGIALAFLLMFWSLELQGLPTPLSLLLPSRASQDLIAPDPRKAGGRAVILCVRCDLPRLTRPLIAPFASRLRELTWLAVGLLGGICAARALGAAGPAMAAIQLAVSLLALAVVSVALTQALAPREGETADWTGLNRALDAVAMLDAAPSSLRVDLAIAGASCEGGVRRLLKGNRDYFAAITAWEHADSASIVELIRSLET